MTFAVRSADCRPAGLLFAETLLPGVMAVVDQAAANRLSKSSGAKILPIASTISTCHPSLAHTLALATVISELIRSTQIVSSSRSAII
jgi:hypothetical protein